MDSRLKVKRRLSTRLQARIGNLESQALAVAVLDNRSSLDLVKPRDRSRAPKRPRSSNIHVTDEPVEIPEEVKLANSELAQVFVNKNGEYDGGNESDAEDVMICEDCQGPMQYFKVDRNSSSKTTLEVKMCVDQECRYTTPLARVTHTFINDNDVESEEEVGEFQDSADMLRYGKNMLLETFSLRNAQKIKVEVDSTAIENCQAVSGANDMEVMFNNGIPLLPSNVSYQHIQPQ